MLIATELHIQISQYKSQHKCIYNEVLVEVLVKAVLMSFDIILMSFDIMFL